MFSCRFYLFCLVAILCISLCDGNSNVKKCAEGDRQALLKFKAGLIDIYDILSSWNGDDCCIWKGITCDNSTGHVTGLSPIKDIYTRLRGKIDSSLCELQHLTSIDLSDNNLEGKIPKCIGSLGQLIEFKLGNNGLASAIPHSLGNLSNLQTLDLWGNIFLVANDLDWVSHLSNLRYLNLSYTDLSQAVDWLPSISKLPSLLQLGLDDCGLPQFNLQSIPQMNSSTSLETLGLSRNYLNSSTLSWVLNVSKVLTELDLSYNNFVPHDLDWVSHLSNLNSLDLTRNNLSQVVDWLPSISKLPSLQNLYLDNCTLYQFNLKSIPQMNSSTSLETLSLSRNHLNSSTLSWVLNVSKVLTELDLSYNIFVPHDLDWVSHLSNLNSLDLTRNNLSQVVDWLPSISKLPSLREVHLDNCGLRQLNLKSIPQMNSSTSLETLTLSNNYLNSSIVSWVLNVSKVLTHLDLSFNILNHSIPEGFANMISLQSLDLSHNEIEGSIPKSFQSWCQLKTLTLSSNKLSGQLSDHLQNLCSGENGIMDLDLSNNQLNGTLPYTIGKFSNLRSLSIYSNKLNGVINEAHLSNLSNLEILFMDQNSLSFNLSSDWVPPFRLSHLSASSCILGPKFPSWLKHQRSLEVLQISNGGISDSFPKWFWDLSLGLDYLNVSHNKLSGALPKSIPSMKYEYQQAEWDLSFNNFFGPLPHFPPSLGLLSVSNNKFSGSISFICATSNLSTLDLSNNLLEGSLPDCWEQFYRLQVLNLATNNFSGRIPKSFGTLQRIETIHLNNNNFSGEVPSLIGCSKLKLIDLGDNNLEGTLPTWVGQNLHRLIVLRLRANKFQGSIPDSLCDLLHLQVLDLSKNYIIGKIPQCLNHIIALSNIKLARVTISYSAGGYLISYEDFEIGLFIDKEILAWKGENREYGKNLGLMTAIDLSCNQLTGEIPHSLTKLVALASLNLSENNLTGFIPNNIGHMEMLESLDLSRNYLSGGIPASLSNLTFLSYMNLSYDNLSGNIPISTQLDTFDAYTYIGNPGLCGQPLSKKCPRDENSPNPQPNGSTNRSGIEGDEDELISFGFYISLGLGFIIGFWGVCGTLVLKTSWRYAYFRFFNNMYDWIYVQLVVVAARLKRRLQVQIEKVVLHFRR